MSRSSRGLTVTPALMALAAVTLLAWCGQSLSRFLPNGQSGSRQLSETEDRVTAREALDLVYPTVLQTSGEIVWAAESYGTEYTCLFTLPEAATSRRH